MSYGLGVSFKVFNQISKLINRFSVKTQVISITILSLIGITAIAVGANYTSVLVAEVTNFNIVATDKASLFSEMDKYGLEMRSHEKDYLSNFGDENVAEYQAAKAAAIEIADKLMTGIEIVENKQTLTEIVSGIEGLSSQFDMVRTLSQELGLDPTKGLAGKLNKSVGSIEDLVADLKSKAFQPGQLDAVSVELFALRMHQKDFMLTGDVTYLKTFETGLGKLAGAIKGVFLGDIEKKKLATSIEGYKSDFQLWSAAEDHLNHEIAKLGQIYANYSPLIKHMIMTYEQASELATEQRISTQQSSNILLAVISVIIGLVIALISFMIASNIAQKIRQLNGRMSSLADGETDAEIPNLGLKNELGDMANSLMVFRDNTVARVQAEVEKNRLDEDEARKSKFIKELIVSFQDSSTASIGNVQQASDRLEGVSKDLSEAAIEMQTQSQTVSDNVQNTSENVVSAASATEEMVASISEIAEQASHSTTIADEARSKTSETVTVINELSSSAKHIEQVVKLIEEIAEQTNLLALNATIEAARAGDAGRGFAVVANEVKSLASQTAKATEEIAERVHNIQADSLKANKAIIDVESIIDKLSDASMGVAAAVEEQSAVISEIAANVTNASDLSTRSAESMKVVGVSIDETKVVSNDVYGLANDLNGQVAKLESNISQFLSGVKSA